MFKKDWSLAKLSSITNPAAIRLICNTEPHVLRLVGNSYCYPIWGITSNQFGMWEVFGGYFDSALLFHDDPGSIMFFRRKRDRAGWYLQCSGCL